MVESQVLKSSSEIIQTLESNNDSLRINGEELRAKIIGEGNLGSKWLY